MPGRAGGRVGTDRLCPVLAAGPATGWSERLCLPRPCWEVAGQRVGASTLILPSVFGWSLCLSASLPVCHTVENLRGAQEVDLLGPVSLFRGQRAEQAHRGDWDSGQRP